MKDTAFPENETLAIDRPCISVRLCGLSEDPVFVMVSHCFWGSLLCVPVRRAGHQQTLRSPCLLHDCGPLLCAWKHGAGVGTWTAASFDSSAGSSDISTICWRGCTNWTLAETSRGYQPDPKMYPKWHAFCPMRHQCLEIAIITASSLIFLIYHSAVVLLIFKH